MESKKSLKKVVANDSRRIFNATDKIEANKHTQKVIEFTEKYLLNLRFPP